MLPRIDTHAFSQKILPLADFKKAWRLAETQQYLKVILAAH
jgi:hypothetical protein